jgi:hypothetical protein
MANYCRAVIKSPRGTMPHISLMLNILLLKFFSPLKIYFIFSLMYNLHFSMYVTGILLYAEVKSYHDYFQTIFFPFFVGKKRK